MEFWHWTKWLVTSFLTVFDVTWKVVAIILTITALLLVTPGLLHRQVIVFNSLLPAKLNGSGQYPSQVADNLREAIQLIYIKNRSSAARTAYDDGSLVLPELLRNPDFGIPQTGLSISTAGELMRRMLGRDDLLIKSAVLCRDKDCRGGLAVDIILEEKSATHIRYQTVRNPLTTADFQELAVLILERTNPFVAATWHTDHKNYDQARNLLNQDVSANPNARKDLDNGLLCNIASREDPNSDAAKSACTMALRLYPDSAFVQNSLGSHAWRRKDYEGARFHFNRALALDPFYANPMFNRCYLDAINPPASNPNLYGCQMAMRLDPDNPAYYDSIADIYETSGNLSAAILAIETAVRLNSDAGEPQDLQELCSHLISIRKQVMEIQAKKGGKLDLNSLPPSCRYEETY